MVALPSQKTEPPDLPKGLHRAVLAWWENYWDSDVANVALKIDAPALIRLARYYDQWERMAEISHETPFSEGSTGQVKMHPAAEQMLRLEQVIGGLEKELGLTPYARARLGLSVGKAKLTAYELNRQRNPDAPQLDPEVAALLEETAE